ncbi:MAG: hypothetical protein HUU15_04860 [Candidatus Brocadiae bacterium]|nr:hypothetical protein [Candidatus Brocadiia bacterium]
MKILKPLRTLDDFRAHYDNGGHPWNLFSYPRDRVLTPGEVASAAGDLFAGAMVVLRFEVLRDGLPPRESAEALRMLDASMRRRHRKHEPRRVRPRRWAAGPAGRMAIVTGIATPHPHPLTVAGDVRVASMDPECVMPSLIPLRQCARLYFVHEEGGEATSGCLMAVFGGRVNLPPRLHRFAGMLLDTVTGGLRSKPTRYLMGQFAVPV